MNDGYICMSFSSVSQNALDDICDILKPLGVSLAMPGSSNVSMWENDGTQTLTTTQGLKATIGEEAAANFQLWYSEGEDIFCNLRIHGGGVICELALDGLDSRRESDLFQTLLRFGVDFDPSRVNWIVYDRAGELSGHSWDEITTTSLLEEQWTNRMNAVYARNEDGKLVYVGGKTIM